MALIFRVMLPDGNRPKIGAEKFMLGVRVGKPPKGDVELMKGMTVMPRTGGMSVVRHWKDLPYFLIPPRLRHLVAQLTKQRAVSGNDEARCWRMGEGEFLASQLTHTLLLRLDSPKHGLVEPSNEVLIEVFQAELADTREAWKIDEES